MIIRNIEGKLDYLSKKQRSVTITGPRQSGKTTISKKQFPDYKYVSLEDIDKRLISIDDPRKFLEEYNIYSIIDEVQRSPDLLSYLQTKIDESNKSGQYILTGSENFILNKAIGQSLVGRTGMLTLLTLTIDEIVRYSKKISTIHEIILKGSYPEVYSRDINATDFYSSYIDLYLQRDIRSLRAVENLTKFSKFLIICAGRAGQILNIKDIGDTVGIDNKTAESWIGILESSYIATRIYPYYANISKRFTKSPKLFFYDTGLVAYLLNISNKSELNASHFYGNIFENLVISEIIKTFTNNGTRPDIYFVKDNLGEVDCITKTAKGYVLIEIKASTTYQKIFKKNIDHFGDLLKIHIENRYLVYNGESIKLSDIHLVNIFDLKTIFEAK